MRKGFLVVGGLILALALGSCGGGSSQEAEVETALRTALLSSAPSKCTQLETPSLIEQSTGHSGKEGLQKCEEDAKDLAGNAESVAIRAIDVDGDSATAEFSPRGSALDGQTVRVSLVEVGGRWKVDSLLRFVGLDRPALAAGIVKADTEKGDFTQARINCFARVIPQISRGEVEAIALDSSDEAVLGLAERCPELPGGPPVRQVAASLDRFARSHKSTKCVEDVTQRFLEQIYDLRGRQALGHCIEATEDETGPTPTTVVFNVQAHEDRATAFLELRGIGLDLQVQKVALIRRYGHWVADRRLGLVHIDKDGYVREVLKGASLLGSDPTPEQAACVRAAILGMSKAEFEALIFDPKLERTSSIGKRCFGGAQVPPAPS